MTTLPAVFFIWSKEDCISASTSRCDGSNLKRPDSIRASTAEHDSWVLLLLSPIDDSLTITYGKDQLFPAPADSCWKSYSTHSPIKTQQMKENQLCSLRAQRMRATKRGKYCFGLHWRVNEVNVLSAESQSAPPRVNAGHSFFLELNVFETVLLIFSKLQDLNK